MQGLSSRLPQAKHRLAKLFPYFGASKASLCKAIFPNLAPNVRKRLAYHAETLTHRAGTMIFVEGDEPDGLHLVRRGSVDLTKIYDGVDKRIDSIRAGSTLGEAVGVSDGAGEGGVEGTGLGGNVGRPEGAGVGVPDG